VKHFSNQNWYELLEVSTDATADDIGRAVKRMSQTFSDDNNALYGLVEADEVQMLRQRIKQASLTLLNAPARAAYDRSLGIMDMREPAPLMLVRTSPTETLPGNATPMLLTEVFQEKSSQFSALHRPSGDISGTQGEVRNHIDDVNQALPATADVPAPVTQVSDADISGAMLAKVRTAMGLTLKQLAERTKISVKHLEHIEQQQFGQLPANVYLKGMLMSLSRELKLDGLQVTRNYLAAMGRSR
jgi:curved DNA-binding protein CbpA